MADRGIPGEERVRGGRPKEPGDDWSLSPIEGALSCAFVEQAPVFVALFDAGLSPVFVNRAGREMLGLSADSDIATVTMADLFARDSQSTFEAIVLPAMARAGRWCGELKMQNFADQSGNQTMSWSIVWLYGAGSDVIGAVAIASNILAREGAEDELKIEQSLQSSMAAECESGQPGFHDPVIVPGEDRLFMWDESLARPDRGGASSPLVQGWRRDRAAAALQEGSEHDRLLEKLKISEAKLRAASALVGLAVYSWDPVRGDLEWDDRLRAIWDVPDGEPIGGDVFWDGIHPGDRKRVERAFRASLDPLGDGRFDIEYRVIGRHDAVERSVATSGQAIFQHGIATAVTGAVVDVTEENRAEAAIHASEARFRAFAQYSANLLWIIDPASNNIEYRSPAYERIWGEPIKDAPSGLDDWLGRVHPDDLQSVRAAQETVKAGELVIHEYRIVRPDGSVRWLRDTSFPIRADSGEVALIGSIVEDLTLYDGNHVYILGRSAGEPGRLINMLRGAGFQVRSFQSASALIDIAPVLTPGCVLIDLRAKARDAMQIPRELKARAVPLPTVMIGPEIADPHSIIAAMKAGAADYLIPPFDDDTLKSALASAMAEMHGLGRIDSTATEAATRVTRLTPREREVLEGLVNGGTNKTIARELGISPRTVELYRSQVMVRLGASNLPELIQTAMAAGVRSRSEASPPAQRPRRTPT